MKRERLLGFDPTLSHTVLGKKKKNKLLWRQFSTNTVGLIKQISRNLVL